MWWLWSQFTWLGTAIDLGGRSAAQFLVLATVPLTLLMAVALPGAFGSSGLEFAGAYLAVNLWALAIQGWGLWRDPATRAAWLRYVPLAALAPLVLLAGALLPRARSLRRVVRRRGVQRRERSRGRQGPGREDRVDRRPWALRRTARSLRHHLARRDPGGRGRSLRRPGTLGRPIGAGLIAAVAVACVFWWTYFAFVPEAVERALRLAPRHDRGRVARDRFTFGHFPIVFGLVLFAVVAKHVVAHPDRPSSRLATSSSLAGAVAFFVGGLLGLQWQAVHRLAPERVAAIGAVAVLCWVAGPRIPGEALLVIVAVIVAIMQAITLRRYDRLRAERTQSARG